MVYMAMSLSSEDCTALLRDNYIQRTLQTFEEEEEELDEKSYTENVIKYLDDMCGWIPDSSIQYRRQPNDNVKTNKGQGKTGKPDWSSLSRRTGRHDNQQHVINYEFKHYTNLRKYIEQYRRFHTCGGPLEKLSQSAYGRTKTVYYSNGKDPGKADNTSKSAERRPDSKTGSRSKPCSKHLPDAQKGGLVRYHEEPSSSSPKYHSLTDVVLRKRSEQSNNLGNYTNNGWSNIPPGLVAGEPPPQKTTSSNKDAPMQWTINEHGLTIYHHDKTPTVFRQKDHHDAHHLDSSQLAKYPAGSFQPKASFLPFFTPTQHLATGDGGLQSKSKQLITPPNAPPNLPVSSGFSIDRTINSSRSSTTGAIHDKSSLFKDFYSHLVHAAVNLQLKQNMESSCTKLADQQAIQNKLNLSPQRPQNKFIQESTKSYDSASTCSSQGSQKRGRSQIKGHERSSVQEHHPINSACSSTHGPKQLGMQGHIKVKGHHDRVSEQHQSTNSATSSRMTSSSSHQIATLRGLPKTAPSSSSYPHHGLIDCTSAYRVTLNLKDYHQQPIELDKKVALCEATWF